MVDERGRSVHGGDRNQRAGALRRGPRALRDRLPVPGAVRRGDADLAARRWRDRLGRRAGALACARSDERGLRAYAAARLSDHRPAEGRMSTATLTQAEQVEARLWDALRRVEDPEIPVSVVGMGLIVSLAFAPEDRRADLQITFTSMGCPAMEFIEEDIRDALLRDPDVEDVEIEVVWDPVWTKDRLRDDARQTMRRLGILA